MNVAPVWTRAIPAIAIALLAAALQLGSDLADPPEARATCSPNICTHFSMYSFPAEAGSCNGGPSAHVDPVTVLFRGRSASVGRVEDHLRKHANWREGGFSDQRLSVLHSDGTYHCDPNGTAVSNHKETDRTSRTHVRLWYIPASPFDGWERQTVGTPHFDHWISYEDNENCGNAITNGSHAVPTTMDIPAKYGGPLSGSGFDFGKYRIAYHMGRGATGLHHLDFEPWGNTEPQGQCNGVQAASNGQGVIIGVNRGVASTNRPQLEGPTSARLTGSFSSEQEPVEWWFGYGQTSSENGAYAFKTPVTTKPPAEGDIAVNQAISSLSKNATYYATMFARYPDGDIETG